MADHELEVHTKLGVPDFMGFAAKFEARYRGTLSRRKTSLVEAIAAEVGVTPEQLGALLVEAGTLAERQRDVFVIAACRSDDVHDDSYRLALAKIVALAMDPARIDEAAYLVSRLARLEPLELRGLMLSAVHVRANGTHEWPVCDVAVATHCCRGVVSAEYLAKAETVSVPVARVALETLTGSGWLSSQILSQPDGQDQQVTWESSGLPLPDRSTWETTEAGLMVVSLILTLKVVGNLAAVHGALSNAELAVIDITPRASRGHGDVVAMDPPVIARIAQRSGPWSPVRDY